MPVNGKGLALPFSLLALVAAQLYACDGPRVKIPVRETPRSREPEPDAGDRECENSAPCTDPEHPFCGPEGECVQCIDDDDCPRGECERGECEESDDEREDHE